MSPGYVMRARGRIVDTVNTVGVPFLKKGAPGNPIPPLRVVHAWGIDFRKERADSPANQAAFARILSCGNWQFDNVEEYAAKLAAIFALSEDSLSARNGITLHPPSRTSTQPLARATTIGSLDSLLDEDSDNESLKEEDKERVGTLLFASLTMNRRRLIISQNGLVGLGLWNVEIGDVICVLLGCRVPVVLRKVDDHYILIGEAYIDDMMEGEALEGAENELQNFEIH